MYRIIINRLLASGAFFNNTECMNSFLFQVVEGLMVAGVEEGGEFGRIEVVIDMCL